MKYVLVFVFGLLLGAAVAGAALFFNPLTQQQAAADRDAAWTLRYSADASRVMLATHDRSLGLPLIPVDAPLLWEQGLRKSVLTVLPLASDELGAAPVASRVSVPSTSTELLTTGVVVDDYWLVSIPGRGSLFVHSVNNHWPLLRDSLVRVDWLKQAWPGPQSYRPTRGPDRRAAAVIGLSGEFSGRRGRAWERIDVDAYDGRFAGLSGRLSVQLAPSAR